MTGKVMPWQPTKGVGVTLTLFVAASTGASLSPAWDGTGSGLVQQRRDVPVLIGRAPEARVRSAALSSAAEDIDFVKATLRLSVTELAKYLGVSRQAVYDWKSGAHVRSENLSKLEKLLVASQVISSSEVLISSLSLSRKLPGGRTLLEAIATGTPGGEAAQALLDMLQREALARKTLEGRFAGRKPTSASQLGVGLAGLNEFSQ